MNFSYLPIIQEKNAMRALPMIFGLPEHLHNVRHLWLPYTIVARRSGTS